MQTTTKEQSKKAAHTPGPWEASCEENDGWKGHSFHVQISAGEVLIASYDTSYCEYPETNEENIANARLIAAAPEMLACLQQISFLLSAGTEEGEQGEPRFMTEVRAAIAKATGA